jgi:hypothetical protein
VGEERARPNALRPGELPGSTDKLEEDIPKLDGKIAVITGGNCGIGLATAKVFEGRRARVHHGPQAGRQAGWQRGCGFAPTRGQRSGPSSRIKR